MTQEEKELLLKLLEKADENGLLNIYDDQENHYETEWMFMDAAIHIKVKEL